jgi:predicted cation transporter
MLKLACGAAVIIVVLVGPVFVELIERNVESFFLLIGVLTAYTIGRFSSAVVWAALIEPLPFTLAVLICGSIFRLLRDYFDEILHRLDRLLDPGVLCFCLATTLPCPVLRIRASSDANTGKVEKT